MKREKLYTVSLTAVFTAICAAATAVVRIPTPATGGHVNPGDAAVLLSAFILGPVFGTAAGGIGSMLADLFLGYVTFAPGTLVIKGLIALVAALIVRAAGRRTLPVLLVAGLAGELIMVFGYFFYEATFLSYGWGAAVSIPANLLQGTVGIALSVSLFKALEAVPFIKNKMGSVKK